jgi:hypothetical protein
MHCIKISNEINCNTICSIVDRAITKFKKENGDISDCVISIEIKKIIDTTKQEIPKIGYNENV